MPRPGYHPSNIPPELAERVAQAVAAHGYRSFDALVKEAVEEKLKRLARRKK